jgi:cobyrinic acid a,c-diamide synthase
MIHNEKIILKEKIKDSVLIVTELKATLLDNKNNILWQHEFHYDIIINAKLNKNLLELTEFNNKKYNLNIKTGKLLNN